MTTPINKMDTNLTGLWVSFFTTAGIPSDVSATYALTFAENRIQNDMLLDLNKEYLRDMGISRMGDVIAILRHAKQVHESTARDRVLSTTAIASKVPVAAVTGRSTVSQPCSSPASRILEHYTRNPQAAEAPPCSAVKLKRKLADVGTEVDLSIKKSRMIRFGSPVQKLPISPKESKSAIKQTVFSRLGNSEVAKVASPVPVSKPAGKPAGKQIYSRLGIKSPNSPPTPPPIEAEQIIPIQKDALKYEGILKGNPPVSKGFTVTTSKNNVRKVAVACTMRADETPMSVKDKLALPKAKSVKFSTHIEYKEIEAIKKNVAVKQKVAQEKLTPVFNKPERRLSMPEPVNVKARLGTKNATKNFTITRNVFNRLGA